VVATPCDHPELRSASSGQYLGHLETSFGNGRVLKKSICGSRMFGKINLARGTVSN
jgi:hypothetical protein